MDIKKIGGGLLTIGIIAFIAYSRMGGGDQAIKGEYEADALALITQAEGYESNQAWYESRAKLAASQALSASSSFEKVGRRARNVFDESLFYPHFFEKLIATAQNEGKMDIVRALIALRDEQGILRPGDIAKG
jgi:hypothetical protein